MIFSQKLTQRGTVFGKPLSAEPPPAKRRAVCPFCDSLHVSDVTCHCRDICTAPWCPRSDEVDPARSTP